VMFVLSLRPSGCTTACGSEEGFFSAYPALIPHPGTPGLGNVPGYYQAVPWRDWYMERVGGIVRYCQVGSTCGKIAK